MTQQQIAIDYITEFGSMLPAKISGFFYKGHICGSEMSKRCRELRKKGILRSEKDGKFERFYLNEQPKIILGGKEIMTIQEKIKELRAKFELTPAQLAEQSNLDPSYISKLEGGIYKSLSLKVSKALAKGFGLTLRDFMEEMGLFPDTSQPSYDLITSALRRNKFSNEQIKQIVDYARFIKKRD